jgi:hypothetical protein
VALWRFPPLIGRQMKSVSRHIAMLSVL